MRKSVWLSIVASTFLWDTAAFAQDVQVNRQNRTIAVEVTETIEVDPDLAIVRVGYHNFGSAQSAVYEENSRVASKIVDALLAAGLKKESIETEKASLGQVESAYKDWTPAERKERQFEAEQMWEIRVGPPDAQKVADQAIAAGANEMQEVSWVVKNPSDLEAKTIGTALTKARELADQMAHQFGGKIGEPLYISNHHQINIVTRSGGGGGGGLRTVEVQAAPKANLKLYPQKVRRDATIYVVFALD
jgi:uncharacterized protein YggE